MPLIEELPVTQSHRVTHGWAYVPDTGTPTIAAIQPGNRKRNRDGAIAATATVKQQKAIQARLDSLDKENYRDGISVPIPTRERGKKEGGRKMTANVRRILTYQRGFAHYLADQEALAESIGPSIAQQQRNPSTMGAKVDNRRKAATPATPTSAADPPPTTPRRGRPPSANKQKKTNMNPPPEPVAVKQEDKGKDTDGDHVMTDADSSQPPATTITTPTTTPAAPPSKPTPSTSSLPKPTYDPKLDAHPLLRTTGLPKMPSARVMAALVAEPPLSYTAARARVVDEGNEKPVRRFCAVCGYWGKVKCRKCGEWTCGIMECWRGHEGVCVARGVI